VRWYTLAAEQGDALAQSNLGVILAQRWYRRHRELEGDPLAGVEIGLLQQELIVAVKWLTLAAGQGNETARANLAVVEPYLSREHLAEARRRAQEWTDARARTPRAPDAIRAPSR
jgi:TPR repeat protein